MTPGAGVARGRMPGSAPGSARVAWMTAMGGALLITLARPLSWSLGLAGFLAGGGVIVVTLPVMVLPTPTGLQNALGGPVSTLVFGTPSAALVTGFVVGTAGALLLVAGGLLAGAWAERAGVAVALEAAADEGLLPGRPAPGGTVTGEPGLAAVPGTVHVAIVRALSLVPVVVVALLALPRLYDATYHELVLPDDLATPLPLRVIRSVPAPLTAVVVMWLLADTAAAVGVRHLLIERRRVLAAWLLGWADLARRPLRVLGTELVGILVLAALLAPALLAAVMGWARVREVADGRDPLALATTVLVWVAIWLGGLVLAGVGAAIRVTAFTLELPRRT